MKGSFMGNSEKIYLITGAAGFIGFHLCCVLLKTDAVVIGYDNLNDYYSVQLKQDRLNILKQNDKFIFYHADLENKSTLSTVFQKHAPQIVINLAAQAGVRYSLENPDAYIHSNIIGFVNILECCRHYQVDHLLYASSSSVYGNNKKVPFSTKDSVDHPISLYAATKKSNELMAHTYSHLFNIPTTGMRFFTVYGPYGRPDMAAFLFLKAISNNEPIKVFNYGDMQRDFTYIDDIINGILLLVDHSQALHLNPPYKVYNIGNNRPEKLGDFIQYIEQLAKKDAIKEYLPLQPGDVPITYADIDELIQDTGYRPKTSLQEGLHSFVNWYQSYYNHKADM